jgi:hypothetical protein
MEFVLQRPIDAAPAAPLHCVCGKIASVPTHCLVALFREIPFRYRRMACLRVEA